MNKFFLNKIKSPKDLKNLNLFELKRLAFELREFILKSVSETGGHLASNLGIIELVVSLHKVFDSPHDKILFDVGHQAYAHKILTGRYNEFKNLRKTLSGFLKSTESDYDFFESGHAGTALGTCLGLLKSENKSANEIIALIGDGSFDNSFSFKAFEKLLILKKKILIIINDNDFAITRSQFNVNSLESLCRSNRVKFYKNVDGHDLKILKLLFEKFKRGDKLFVIHVKTIKGKGYSFSENDQKGLYHKVLPFSLSDGVSFSHLPTNEKYINQTILKLFDKNKHFLVLSQSHLASSIDPKFFYPACYDLGMNEELSVIFAKGLSLNKRYPLFQIASTFITRISDFLYFDFVRENKPLCLIVEKCGLSDGDGNTHHGLMELSVLKTCRFKYIFAPASILESEMIIRYCFENKLLAAIKYPKKLLPISLDTPLEICKWQFLKQEGKFAFIAYSENVSAFLNLDGIIINASTINPLDEEALLKISDKKIFVYEKTLSFGSLYEAIVLFYQEKKLDVKVFPLNFGSKIPDLVYEDEYIKNEKLNYEHVEAYINKCLNDSE